LVKPEAKFSSKIKSPSKIAGAFKPGKLFGGGGEQPDTTPMRKRIKGSIPSPAFILYRLRATDLVTASLPLTAAVFAFRPMSPGNFGLATDGG
jgi:hypothetical protein